MPSGHLWTGFFSDAVIDRDIRGLAVVDAPV
jgi:hypothetical protein